MSFIHTTVLSLLFSTVFCQYLRFYDASKGGGIDSWKPSKFVATPAFTVCPNDLPSQFTLICFSPRPVSYAQFFINGRLSRTERVYPYTISGDFAGTATPWSPPPSATVLCKFSDGSSVTSTITFACGRPDAPPPTRPPATRPPTTRPPTTRAPVVAPPPPPSFEFSSGSTASGSNCVRIPALSYTGLTGSGWENRGSALWYKPNDSSTGITAAGSAVATYKFKAPTSGRFGVTVDMHTNGGVDHNDIWLLFEPNGFILTKGGSVSYSGGWTKAYHNKNGRSNQVFSVDFNAHTFATNNNLEAGKEYTIKVAGRSTKTGFYSIILFPCSGTECDGINPGNSYWSSTRNKCT